MCEVGAAPRVLATTLFYNPLVLQRDFAQVPRMADIKCCDGVCFSWGRNISGHHPQNLEKTFLRDPVQSQVLPDLQTLGSQCSTNLGGLGVYSEV